ncbi:MAG: hypothetical protein KBC02_04300 [Candidatus Pacebacteria bacterium]|nr:hypothetical protein [Candidatus Paceibacterota bacterium]
MESPQPPSTFQPIDRPTQLPPQPRAPRRVSKKLAFICIAISIALGWFIGTYGEGIIWKPDYPVLSDPSKKPPTEVPALFSQSGTVTAIDQASLTIQYGSPTKTITFPLASSTKYFKLFKDTSSSVSIIITESSAALADIAIGTQVSVQIPEASLKAVAPLKVQILP